MRKSKRPELSPEQTQRLIKLALEERNPFEAIKKEFGLSEQEVCEVVKSQIKSDRYELWKKKAVAAKPKPKPMRVDDFDEDLDGKYYIKNKFD